MFRKKAPPCSTVDDGDQPSAPRAKAGKQIAAKLGRNPLVERVANDKTQLFVRRNFLSPEECAELCAMIDAGAQPSKLFSGTEGPEYRTSHSCHMTREDPLVQAVSNRIAALMGIDPAKGETIQGQRYTLGQQYKPHWDFFPVNDTYWPHMKAQGGQRTWTAMAYLSAVERGGETHFPYAGLLIPPSLGTLVMWNNLDRDGAPNRDTLHAALPVQEGAKYVVTKWFRERGWLANE